MESGSSYAVHGEHERTGVSVETLRHAIRDNLFYRCGNVPQLATRTDYYLAVAYTVRDRLMQRWLSTNGPG